MSAHQSKNEHEELLKKQENLKRTHDAKREAILRENRLDSVSLELGIPSLQQKIANARKKLAELEAGPKAPRSMLAVQCKDNETLARQVSELTSQIEGLNENEKLAWEQVSVCCSVG